jgi:6-phosphogluconolactonase (cycloisomerase 2 family)
MLKLFLTLAVLLGACSDGTMTFTETNKSKTKKTFLFVSNNSTQTITSMLADNFVGPLKVVGTTSIGCAPTTMKLDLDKKKLYVGCGTGLIYSFKVDSQSGVVTPTGYSVNITNSVNDIFIVPSKNKIMAVVTLAGNSGVLVEVNRDSGQMTYLSSVSIGAVAQTTVVADATGDYFYTCAGTNVYSGQISGPTLSAITQTTVSNTCNALVINKAGNTVYYALTGANAVVGAIYVNRGTFGAVSSVNLTTTMPPSQLALSDSESTLASSHTGASTCVTAIRIENLTQLRELASGAGGTGCQGIAIDSIGDNVWVTNNTVSGNLYGYSFFNRTTLPTSPHNYDVNAGSNRVVSGEFEQPE